MIDNRICYDYFFANSQPNWLALCLITQNACVIPILSPIYVSYFIVLVIRPAKPFIVGMCF